jgi:uncharacterized membrane protein SpoIIM required for sporulation
MSKPLLRSYEFRREREATWLELEALVERVEKRGIGNLSAAELARMPVLYRAALSSLSVARSISLDRNVVVFLESLCGRAYLCVYSSKRRFKTALVEFLTAGLPQAVRSIRWSALIAALCMVVGAVTAYALINQDTEYYYTFVDEEYAQGRGPTTSTAELRDGLYDTAHQADSLTDFAAQLFSHNAKIGLAAFALGVGFGIPVFYLMFANGLILGAFAALYQGRGLGVDLWGWILPHGVTELLAVILCGGAGLVLAHAFIFPGRFSRRDSLAMRGQLAGRVVLGAVGLFFIAGLIEGIFRQSVTSVPIRYSVAGGTALWWSFYFGFVGRGKRNV